MLTRKSALLGAAIMVSPLAGADVINVGGVLWDPDSPLDMTMDSSFTQWFQSTNSGYDMGSLVGINATNATTMMFGNYLYGGGKINNFNDANDQTGQPNPETNPADFCPGCELTYEFGGIEFVENTPGGGDFLDPSTYTVDWSQSYFKIWVDDSRNFNANNDFETNPNEMYDATDGNLFLEGSFESVSFTGQIFAAGMLFSNAGSAMHVTGGLAQDYFDTDPFVTLGGTPFDFSYTASSQFMVDLAGGGDVFFARASTAELQGDTISIPEPGALALLGAGLIGLARVRRRHDAA
ncbi:PEP-CTERM sorting domain-containing protein [Marichromatium gracile]|uniref:Ice-binding protein C-terminal domain-containing protein n=1 Tax=Marichromatium gracile TaxID=1048 RepID=A0ABR5VF54_MARGR|nr:PEP-CTERM sorting domain-containing protein [Marichromatium gracile]KXX63965.1 hypothetical protein AY586_15325 [Marichromatium gracile]